jgi:hypothetical protein
VYNFPFVSGGAISLIYSGTTTAAAPLLSPLMNLPSANVGTFVASAFMTAAMMKPSEFKARVLLRPYRFPIGCDASAPNNPPRAKIEVTRPAES